MIIGGGLWEVHVVVDSWQLALVDWVELLLGVAHASTVLHRLDFTLPWLVVGCLLGLLLAALPGLDVG